jgi:hypothetical protein
MVIPFSWRNLIAPEWSGTPAPSIVFVQMFFPARLGYAAVISLKPCSCAFSMAYASSMESAHGWRRSLQGLGADHRGEADRRCGQGCVAIATVVGAAALAGMLVGRLTLWQRLALGLAATYTPVGVFLIDQWKRIGVNVEHSQVETPTSAISSMATSTSRSIPSRCPPTRSLDLARID